MQPQGQQDYKQLLSQVIKKQIVILGPDITLAKARNVQGLTVENDGTVSNISGDPQSLTQKLVEQFVQLSGEIVRKTMEPLLNMNQVSQTPVSPSPAPVAPAITPPQTPVMPTQSPAAPPPDATAAQASINASLGTSQPISQDPLAQQAKPVQ